MKKGSIIIASLIIPLAIILYFQTLSLSVPTSPGLPGPAYIPRAYLMLAVILAINVIVKSFIEKSSQQVKLDKLGYLFKGFSIMAIYVILLNIIGYFLATFLFVFGMALFMGTKRNTGLFVSFIFLIFIYIVFYKIFSLPLPKGILF